MREKLSVCATRQRAFRQSLCRPARLQARDSDARTSQWTRARRQPRDKRNLANLTGAERRRRTQRTLPGTQLWMAARQSWPRLFRTCHLRATHPPGRRRSRGRAVALYWTNWSDVLYRDRFPLLETECVCRWIAQGGVPRTGHIERVVFNERWEEIRREPMLTELKQRIRERAPRT